MYGALSAWCYHADIYVASIKRILNLNAPTTDPDAEDDSSQPPQTADGPEWKVLVFDASGRDIISTVLRVTDLREAGVTVHLLLTSKRQPVPDTVRTLKVELLHRLMKAASNLSHGTHNRELAHSHKGPLQWPI
jgi:hypothetical protein